ncbi:MAG TPA: hypothetical protein VM118_03205 [Acidobacteriota bacterium]|nr:hypothetical protein [Acidobacteriota bacterium]
MRGFPARIVLAALGVLMLSGGAVRQEAGRGGQAMTAAERQVWLDALVRQWPAGIVPISALHRAESSEGLSPLLTVASGASSLDCPPMLEVQLTDRMMGHWFDEEHGISEIFALDLASWQIMKYEIDSMLNVTSGLIAADDGAVWFAEDLDRDGEVELVMQWADELKIMSAPDWRLRARFVFSGMPIVMNPVPVNIDDDAYLEIYATPNTWGEDGLLTIIKYDEPSDSFKIIFQMWAPNGAVGHPAVADFDEDGRMEFISGNNLEGGHELFEWRDSVLVYCGSVWDSSGGMNAAAVACRPRPDGLEYALLGASIGGTTGNVFRLMRPIGDNMFETDFIFQDLAATGSHPCWATDTDCDGLDEMLMSFYPLARVWEWDEATGTFTSGCSWDAETYGTLVNWYTVDLDQDGSPEWGTTNGHYMFRAFPDTRCVFCDSLNHCATLDACACACQADPYCDGLTNVLDAVLAVDIAFRGAELQADPFAQCPAVRTDVDCDGVVNVLDVVHIVNVAFRSGDPLAEFCDPCE